MFQMKQLTIFLASIVIFAPYTNAARILALLPFAAKSHHIFFQAVLKSLAFKGHQVIVYSPFPLEKPINNYKDVYVNTSFSENFVTYDIILNLLQASRISLAKEMWRDLDCFTEDAFKNENIKKLAQSNEKFDLVITEPFFGQEALLGFGYKFKTPTVALQPLGSFALVNSILGNSLSLSHIPDFSLPLTDQMTFYERIVNSYSILSTLISFYNEHIPKQEALLNRYLNNSPPLKEMLQNISLVLTNGHPTIHYAEPQTPNIIPLGGIHVVTERKALPQKILSFMETAPNGVIYFSLGTVVPDHQMPREYFEKFFKVFQSLPQKVLWKTRAENLTDLPDNVMIVKWAPQQDILAHPNCVLFLTHGGLLSLLETVYAGVPVVGIPFFNDQPLNVRYYEHREIGVKLDFLHLSETTIFEAITKVLNNTQYKKNSHQLSRIFKDLPISQRDSAVFWVEYVLRHHGAQHLQPASVQLSWYQLFLMDIFATIITFIFLIIALLYYIYRKISPLVKTLLKEYNFKKKKL